MWCKRDKFWITMTPFFGAFCKYSHSAWINKLWSLMVACHPKQPHTHSFNVTQQQASGHSSSYPASGVTILYMCLFGKLLAGSLLTFSDGHLQRIDPASSFHAILLSHVTFCWGSQWRKWMWNNFGDEAVSACSQDSSLHLWVISCWLSGGAHIEWTLLCPLHWNIGN